MTFWNIVSGLAIFLLAMGMLEQAIRGLAGGLLSRWLGEAARPASSAWAGMVVTLIVQSSTLTSLLVLAFAAAGTLPLLNAIAAIIGATLGTTGTGWLVALFGFKFSIESIAVPVIGAGALASLVGTPERPLATTGRLLVAFGLLLLGLGLMKTSAGNLTLLLPTDEPLALPGWLFLLGGMVVTAAIQSSTATVLLTLTALHGGLITLADGAFIVTGANLGTTSTMVIATLRGAAMKRRLALANILYHGFCSALGVALLLLLGTLNWQPGWDPTIALAAFHTSFTLAGMMLFWPLLQPLTHWLERRFGSSESERVAPWLVASAATVPAAATAATERAVRLLGEHVIALNARNLRLPGSFDLPAIPTRFTFEQRYELIKRLEGEILRFVLQTQTLSLESREADTLQHHLDAARSLVLAAKSLKDIRANLAELRHHSAAGVIEYIEQQRTHAVEIYRTVLRLLKEAHDRTYVGEQLELLQPQLAQAHREGHELLYQHGLSGIDEMTLSTLLNVNRELWQSNRELATAVAALYSLN